MPISVESTWVSPCGSRMMSPAVELDRLFALELGPATSFHDGVIADEVIGAAAGKHLVDDALALRSLRHPRPAGMHVEEERAGQAHRAQHIGKSIHEFLAGRTIKKAGRVVIRIAPGSSLLWQTSRLLINLFSSIGDHDDESLLCRGSADASRVPAFAASAAEPASATHRYLIERTFPAGALDGVDATVKQKVNANNKTLGRELGKVVRQRREDQDLLRLHRSERGRGARGRQAQRPAGGRGHRDSRRLKAEPRGAVQKIDAGKHRYLVKRACAASVRGDGDAKYGVSLLTSYGIADKRRFVLGVRGAELLGRRERRQGQRRAVRVDRGDSRRPCIPTEGS